MAELIIGHAAHDSAKVWVRGGERLGSARVTLVAARGGGRFRSEALALSRARDWTGVATIRGLDPDSDYEVGAHFAATAEGLDRGDVARVGTLHTAPPPGRADDFDFLLGSCNLSTARLTALRELAAGYFGSSALRRSLERPIDTWYWPKSVALRRVIRRLAPALSNGLLGVVQEATRYQLPEPGFPSPFRPLRERQERARHRPAFMIHAGDQIYFDVDFPERPPSPEEYRRAYRQAWFEDPDARAFLAHGSHYMILDDHDIIDSFDNDSGSPGLCARRDAALRAYRQYVHARQPDSPVADGLFYRFEWGSASFFVLDTRSQRHSKRNQMIDPRQMRELLCWLETKRDGPKFVVSSVPFVAQLRPPDAGELDERGDKWCAEAFCEQRDEIIDHVYRERIGQLVFLTGDMHCAYHAILRVGPPKDRIAVHELAGGPIHQLQFAPRRRFYEHRPGRTRRGTPFASLLRSFHGSAPSVTQVSVHPGRSPLVHWEVVRTAAQPRSTRYQPRTPRGCIRFGETGP